MNWDNISMEWIFAKLCVFSASQNHDWASSCCFWKCNRDWGCRWNIMINKLLVFLLLLDMQERLRNCMQMLYKGFPEFGSSIRHLSNTHHQELMKSVGSHGSSSLQSMMKVMLWLFVTNSHKVMTPRTDIFH